MKRLFIAFAAALLFISCNQNKPSEQKAVADKSYSSKLYLSESTMDNRIYDPQTNRKSIDVDVVNLDNYFNKYLIAGITSILPIFSS